MTEYLPWRAPHREDAALGLLSDHVGNDETMVAGTIGSVADAENPFDVNIIGYAVAQSELGGDTTYKGIDMVEHTVTLDPASTQIQGKLIGSATFVDAMPGALPVYLGVDIDMKVEPVTNMPMYGKVTAVFYLDLRSGRSGVRQDTPFHSSGPRSCFIILLFYSRTCDAEYKTFLRPVITINFQSRESHNIPIGNKRAHLHHKRNHKWNQ